MVKFTIKFGKIHQTNLLVIIKFNTNFAAIIYFFNLLISAKDRCKTKSVMNLTLKHWYNATYFDYITQEFYTEIFKLISYGDEVTIELCDGTKKTVVMTRIEIHCDYGFDYKCN